MHSRKNHHSKWIGEDDWEAQCLPSWLLKVRKVSHGTSLCEQCTFCFKDWIHTHPIGSRVYGIIPIIAIIAWIAIIAIIEIDKLQ